jgi:hypothetical protein
MSRHPDGEVTVDELARRAADGDRDALSALVRAIQHPMWQTDAVIDYRVHYVGAAGLRRPKVFKLTRRRLVPGRAATVTRRHRFENISIRRINPGRHTIDIQINGRILGAIDLDVVDPTTTKPEQSPPT